MDHFGKEYRTFLKTYPEYDNAFLDELQSKEFPYLVDSVYADYTGAALPPVSLLDEHNYFLKTRLLGNPHSTHAPSLLSTLYINDTRNRILKYFKADAKEYSVIFTANASSAILLLRNFMFTGGELLLLADNHNACNGLREIVKREGGIIRYADITEELTIDEKDLKEKLSHHQTNGNRLFIYPLKSNYTGIIHSKSWVGYAQKRGWSVLLDIAAYSCNNQPLDLRKIKPDFLSISFYKMFGFPTGVGCLIIKRPMFDKMHKVHFSGGSIQIVSVKRDFFAHEAIGHARYEDGTPSFAMIPAISAGLQFRESLGDVMPRVVSLTKWMYDNIQNNQCVQIHSPRGCDTITFSLRKKKQLIDPVFFEKEASKSNISVRTGCFCNPGVNEKIFGYDPIRFQKRYNNKTHPEHILTVPEVFNDSPIGAIRASFGYGSNFNDAYRFVEYVNNFSKWNLK